MPAGGRAVGGPKNRRLVAVAASLALALAGALAAAGALPAQALVAGVPFSADAAPTWQTNGVAYAVAGVGGVVAVGGSFSQVKPPTGGTGSTLAQTGLVLLDADTGSPTTCQFRLSSSSGAVTVRAITAAPNGTTLYVAGNFTSVNGKLRSRVAAIDPVTCTLASFSVPTVNAQVSALYATADTVYLGGLFTSVGGQTRNRAAAVTAATGALTGFDPNLTSTDVADADHPAASLPVTEVRAFTMSPDRSRLAVGGEFDLAQGRDSHALVVVSPTTGSLLNAFPMFYRPNALNYFDNDASVNALTSDGTSFYVGGTEPGDYFGGVGRQALAWDYDGFPRWSVRCSGNTQALTVLDGMLYAASPDRDCSPNGLWQGDEPQHLTAQSVDSVDNSFVGWFPDTNEGPSGVGPRGISAVRGASGAQWFWSVGDFTTVNGVAQRSITRFGTTDTGVPAAPTLTAEALLANQVQIRFRSVVDADDSVLTYKVYRNGGTKPIWTDTVTSSFWSRPQATISDTGLVAGTTYSYRATVTDSAGNVSALSAPATATVGATSRPYAAAVIADRPAFYWRYDETSGSLVQDKKGASVKGINGLAGTPGGVLRNVTGAVTGDPSRAVTLDGTKGYLWEDRFQLNPSTRTLSLETWFKTTTTTGGLLLGYGDARESTDTQVMPTSTSVDQQLFLTDDGKVNLGIGTTELRSPASYNNGAWHHVVASLGAAGLQLYVDGQPVASVPTATGPAGSLRGVWHVGFDVVGVQTSVSNQDGTLVTTRTARWPILPTSSYFAGSIDETAVYPTQLTAAQVLNHYTLGRG